MPTPCDSERIASHHPPSSTSIVQTRGRPWSQTSSNPGPCQRTRTTASSSRRRFISYGNPGGASKTATERCGSQVCCWPSHLALSRVSPTYPDGDYWRFTPAGITELFSRHWNGDFTVHAKGNLRSCVGFLLGEVIEEVPNGVLDRDDPRFPLNVAVEAHRCKTVLARQSTRTAAP